LSGPDPARRNAAGAIRVAHRGCDRHHHQDEFGAGGNLDLYGGSWGTVSPSVEYGGGAGDTQYFMTGRYLISNQGLENATPMENPIHDRTTQENFSGMDRLSLETPAV